MESFSQFTNDAVYGIFETSDRFYEDFGFIDSPQPLNELSKRAEKFPQVWGDVTGHTEEKRIASAQKYTERHPSSY